LLLILFEIHLQSSSSRGGVGREGGMEGRGKGEEEGKGDGGTCSNVLGG